MDLKTHICLVVLAVSFMAVLVSCQSCQNNYVLSLYQCLGNRSLDRDNFLWVARNGTLGTEPSDLQAFTSRICIEKPGLFLCMKAALDNSLSLPEAQCPATQKSSLTKLFKDIFKTLNKKCQDPCRATFKQNLLKCYSDQEFQPMEFDIFNITSKRDSILGSNKTQVDMFCEAKTSIIQCMKMAAVQCNDSPTLLRSYNLDIDDLNNTYSILCNSTVVYMDTIDCFRTPTDAVVRCRGTLAKEVSQLESQLEDLNITESVYKQDLCRLRVDQIKCETVATQATNASTGCSDVILGMRRQQECSLVPNECRPANRDRLNQLCKVSDFFIPERHAHKASASLQNSNLSLIMITFLSFLIVIKSNRGI